MATTRYSSFCCRAKSSEIVKKTKFTNTARHKPLTDCRPATILAEKIAAKIILCRNAVGFWHCWPPNSCSSKPILRSANIRLDRTADTVSYCHTTSSYSTNIEACSHACDGAKLEMCKTVRPTGNLIHGFKKARNR